MYVFPLSSDARKFFPWLGLSILLAGLFPGPPLGANIQQPATVLARVLNMRAGPGRHNAVIATLHKGTRVLVLSYEGEWVRILHGDQTGFVMNRESFLRIDDPVDSSPQKEPATEEKATSTDTINQKIVVHQKKLDVFVKNETDVIKALDETERALTDARRKVTILTDELKAIAKRIKRLEDQYEQIETRARVNEEYVAGRLTALYKLNWLGRFHILASAQSMFDFLINKRAMERILAQDEVVMAQLERDRSRMQALLAQLGTQKKEKQVTKAKLDDRIGTMNRRQAKREALLAEIRSKKSLQLAAIASLEASTRELDRKMVALGEKSASTETLPQMEIREKPFASLKGLLMMPVNGKIISFFGQFNDERLNVTRFQSGIAIKADRGEPVRAVYGGQTLFSSWFKGFGNMMIIDHGDHYYTVYAHLEEQFKSKGDPVETGEVIATVGDTGSLIGAGLHFEVRYRGKPMNPLHWIKKG